MDSELPPDSHGQQRWLGKDLVERSVGVQGHAEQSGKKEKQKRMNQRKRCCLKQSLDSGTLNSCWPACTNQLNALFFFPKGLLSQSSQCICADYESHVFA